MRDPVRRTLPLHLTPPVRRAGQHHPEVRGTTVPPPSPGRVDDFPPPHPPRPPGRDSVPHNDPPRIRRRRTRRAQTPAPRVPARRALPSTSPPSPAGPELLHPPPNHASRPLNHASRPSSHARCLSRHTRFPSGHATYVLHHVSHVPSHARSASGPASPGPSFHAPPGSRPGDRPLGRGPRSPRSGGCFPPPHPPHPPDRLSCGPRAPVRGPRPRSPAGPGRGPGRWSPAAGPSA